MRSSYITHHKLPKQIIVKIPTGEKNEGVSLKTIFLITFVHSEQGI
jgi:hypothetical protein